MKKKMVILAVLILGVVFFAHHNASLSHAQEPGKQMAPMKIPLKGMKLDRPVKAPAKVPANTVKPGKGKKAAKWRIVKFSTSARCYKVPEKGGPDFVTDLSIELRATPDTLPPGVLTIKSRYVSDTERVTNPPLNLSVATRSWRDGHTGVVPWGSIRLKLEKVNSWHLRMESRFHIGPTRGGNVTLTLNASTNGRRSDSKSLVFKACKSSGTNQGKGKDGKPVSQGSPDKAKAGKDAAARQARLKAMGRSLSNQLRQAKQTTLDRIRTVRQQRLQRNAALKARMLSDLRPAGARQVRPGLRPGQMEAMKESVATRQAELALMAETPPNIIRMSVSSGQPGDPVRLDGNAFGDTPGKVFFVVAPGRTLESSVEFWSNESILTTVRLVDGIGEFAGALYIERHTDTGGVRSNLMDFRFKPELVTKWLPRLGPRISTGSTGILGDVLGTNWSRGNPTGNKTISTDCNWNRSPSTAVRGFPVSASHRRIEFTVGDCRGRDEFYKATRLKNGWSVKHIGFIRAVSESGEANAYLVNHTKLAGSTDPSFGVEFWVSPADSVVYGAWVEIEGPKGVPWD